MYRFLLQKKKKRKKWDHFRASRNSSILCANHNYKSRFFRTIIRAFIILRKSDFSWRYLNHRARKVSFLYRLWKIGKVNEKKLQDSHYSLPFWRVFSIYKHLLHIVIKRLDLVRREVCCGLRQTANFSWRFARVPLAEASTDRRGIASR